MKRNKVCVVWQEVPESTRVYLLDLDETDTIRVKKAHNKYINACTEEDTTSVEWLQNRLDEEYEQEDPIGPVDLVIVCGFLL